MTEEAIRKQWRLKMGSNDLMEDVVSTRTLELLWKCFDVTTEPVKVNEELEITDRSNNELC